MNEVCSKVCILNFIDQLIRMRLSQQTTLSLTINIKRSMFDFAAILSTQILSSFSKFCWLKLSSFGKKCFGFFTMDTIIFVKVMELFICVSFSFNTLFYFFCQLKIKNSPKRFSYRISPCHYTKQRVLSCLGSFCFHIWLIINNC